MQLATLAEFHTSLGPLGTDAHHLQIDNREHAEFGWIPHQTISHTGPLRGYIRRK